MSARPWLCPEPRCLPLINLRDGDWKDITEPAPGRSFFCWGLMPEPVPFSYDGVEHNNDRNFCTYTPLKGLIRLQTYEGDWSALASYFRMAGEFAADPEYVAAVKEAKP